MGDSTACIRLHSAGWQRYTSFPFFRTLDLNCGSSYYHVKMPKVFQPSFHTALKIDEERLLGGVSVTLQVTLRQLPQWSGSGVHLWACRFCPPAVPQQSTPILPPVCFKAKHLIEVYFICVSSFFFLSSKLEDYCDLAM